MSSSSDSSIKIECEENCGNSPKKQLLKDFSISAVKKEMGICLEWVTDDIVWNILAHTSIQGKSAFEELFKQMMDHKVQELYIHNIITHGNVASLNGTVIVNEDYQKILFCNVFNFKGFGKNSKIKEITSYVIIDSSTGSKNLQ